MTNKMVGVAFLLASSSAMSAPSLCDDAYKLASQAAFYRDQGLTQEVLRYPLPPRNYFAADPDNPKNAKLQFMHQVVDEVFVDRKVDAETYASFKAEQCQLLALTPEGAANFSAALPRLKECAALTGSLKTECAKQAANALGQSHEP